MITGSKSAVDERFSAGHKGTCRNAAGVLTVSVNNIETGFTPTPRPATMLALKKALEAGGAEFAGVTSRVGRGVRLRSGAGNGDMAHELNTSVAGSFVVKAGPSQMGEETGGEAAGNDVLEILAARLAREAGVTEEQAHELISLLGTDWNSLL